MQSVEGILTKQNLLEIGLDTDVSEAIFKKYEELSNEYPSMYNLKIGFGNIVSSTLKEHQLQTSPESKLSTVYFHAIKTPVIIQFNHKEESKS